MNQRASFLHLRSLTHLSQLAGLSTRETAPGLHRGQKVCTTNGLFSRRVEKVGLRLQVSRPYHVRRGSDPG
jgi:hypothetical protein